MPEEAISSKSTLGQTEILVEISKDQMNAFLFAKGDEELTFPSKAELMFALEQKGVIEGIKQQELDILIKDKLWNQKHLVAEGTPAKDGKDGYVKYLFNTKINRVPEADELGNMDFKELDLIQNVSAQTEIAVLIPPKEGEDGLNVIGEPIQAKKGKPATLSQPSKGHDTNTEIHPDKSDTLIATVDGNVLLRGKDIKVDPMFLVDGDVDFQTGNIKFQGTVLVKGDVKSDFSVEANSDVEIRGLVEDATIKAEGNVLIKGGLLGKGSGRIEAGENVIIRFCENQLVIAKGDVICGRGLKHARVETEGTVQAQSREGVIVGGSIVADQGVKVTTLGNDANVKTSITVGVRSHNIKHREELLDRIERNNKNKDDTEKAIQELERIKLIEKPFSKNKVVLLEKLNQIYQQLEKENRALKTEKAELEEKLAKELNATVEVSGVTYPGVIIAIGENRYVVTEELSECIFRRGAHGKIEPFAFDDVSINEPETSPQEEYIKGKRQDEKSIE